MPKYGSETNWSHESIEREFKCLRNNPRKLWGRKRIGIIMAMFGSVMGKTYLNNRFESFLELFCFRSVQNNPDVIIGEAQTQDFYDFGFFESVTKPPNAYYLSLETPGHLKQIKSTMFGNSNLLTFSGKTGTDK